VAKVVAAAIALFFAGVCGQALSSLFADELKAWMQWMVKRLLELSIEQLPDAQRERFEEEWQSHLNEVPGEVSKLAVAANFVRAARVMARESGEALNPVHDFLKRSLDLAVGGCSLAFCMPMFLLVALLIRLDSEGPVLFRREMVGLGGRTFFMYRCRTFAIEDQGTRVTSVGRFLRASYLYQFPVLINIARGDMSLVGPRPRPQKYVEKACKEIADYAARNRIRPGLTGLAQVNSGFGPLQEHADDLFYIKNRSLSLDASILRRTIGRALWIPRQSGGK
jgi:lipopolysaccharide/colanic/teichoic acid biosynthesis glycosyltransferase